MNKPSKCKNCQWYGKPYWSIINPCDNCNKEDVEIFTHWIDPTIQEKDKEIERLNNIINELEKYHIKSMKNLENTEDFKYVGTNHIKILYEEHKRTLDKLKELKESGNNE